MEIWQAYENIHPSSYPGEFNKLNILCDYHPDPKIKKLPSPKNLPQKILFHQLTIILTTSIIDYFSFLLNFI